MKPIILVSSTFLNLISSPGIIGMTLFPFIIVRHKDLLEDKKLINHETIHIYQQIQMLILFFYIWYLSEFLIKWVRFGSKDEAYRNISFEKEAYANEHNLDYLKNRPFWAHLKWL